MFKVFVSNDISEKGIALLREHFDVDVCPNVNGDELLKVINNYDAMVTRSQMKFPKEIINAATRLKVIGRAGVGVDNIDVAAATAKGIMVINAPEGNTLAATEHTIAMIMAMTRHIPQAHQSLQEGRWDRKSFDGIQVAGKTLGIIGLGRIGSRVALRMQAMEMVTIAYDPYITKERAKQLNVELVDNLDDLLVRADYVTIHTPLTEETKNMLCAENIAKMKDGVRIANIARGGCMDHQAVADAIRSGKVAGCCCDVYTEEPLKNNPFLGMKEVVQTPHLGASTVEAQVGVAVDVAYGVIDALEGRPVMSAVNMAPISKAVAETLQHYFPLAERMGSVAMGVTDGAVEKVEIEYTGDLAATDTKLLTIAVLKGLLTPVMGERVNFVNAMDTASKMNIQVKESQSNSKGYYSTLIKIFVKTEKGEHRVFGTLFDGRVPKIVDIDSYRLDFEPKGILLLVPHVDKPNMIGQIATVLGAAGVNINSMQVGATPQADMNIMAIAIGSVVDKSLVEKIIGIDGILGIKMVRCGE